MPISTKMVGQIQQMRSSKMKLSGAMGTAMVLVTISGNNPDDCPFFFGNSSMIESVVSILMVTVTRTLK